MNLSDFLCGLAAGWAQILTGQPLDFIKIKMQTQTLKGTNISSAFKEIYQEYGLKGFYRGSSSLFLGFGFTIATQFLVYEWAKREIFKYLAKTQSFDKQSHRDQSTLDIKYIGLSGLIVGIAVSFIYCPVEYAKIQIQLNKGMSGGSAGFLLRDLKKNGITNLSNGFAATLVREMIGSAVYYASYQILVRLLCKNNREKANTVDFMMAGGGAGFVYWLISYPIDTIKTNLQTNKTISQAFSAVRNIRIGQYKVVLTRSLIVNSCSFLVYQKCRELCKRINNLYYSVY